MAVLPDYLAPGLKVVFCGTAEVLGVHRVPTGTLAHGLEQDPLERVNKENNRRARVLGNFPNDAAVTASLGPS